MAKIAFLESGDNPAAVQKGQPPGLTGYGLYQITPTSGITQNGKFGNLLNASNNTKAAISLFNQAGGYSPWVTAKFLGLDAGGWLPPGKSMVVNNTGQHERVTPPGSSGISDDARAIMAELRALRQAVLLGPAGFAQALSGSAGRAAARGYYQ